MGNWAYHYAPRVSYSRRLIFDPFSTAISALASGNSDSHFGATTMICQLQAVQIPGWMLVPVAYSDHSPRGRFVLDNSAALPFTYHTPLR